MEIGEVPAQEEDGPESCLVVPEGRRRRVAVAVSSPCMGTGDDELGAALMKAFLFFPRDDKSCVHSTWHALRLGITG